MSSIRALNPRIKWFNEEMRKKLRLNTHKPDARGCYKEDMMEKLLHEVEELTAVINHSDRTAIISECADVANYAMMIADMVKP